MPYSQSAKLAAKTHVAAIRAVTQCAQCGKQPIEWHSEDHLTNTNRRVAHLVALGFPISVIDAEIAVCTALCRSCHMAEDGRLIGLTAFRPLHKGTSLPPKPCTECGRSAKPLRRGLCNRCNHRLRAQMIARITL